MKKNEILDKMVKISLERIDRLEEEIKYIRDLNNNKRLNLENETDRWIYEYLTGLNNALKKELEFLLEVIREMPNK